MNFIEKFSGIFLIAGLGLFLFGFITLAGLPIWMVDQKDWSSNSSKNFLEMTSDIALEVPEISQKDFPELESYKTALRRGRDLYIGEGCWHCHSQYVRPTANESLRYGPVSTVGEYQNELHLPQLFGTRRVGPDLIRESGKRPNDWHFAHLYNPQWVVPQSIMPSYPWYFELNAEGVPIPKPDAKALVAYLQWLGKDFADRKENQYDYEEEHLPPRE